MIEQEHNNVQWRKVKLGDCLKQKPDYGINAPAVPYDNNLPTYLRITDITEDGCYSKKDIVSVANQAALKYVLEEGDLVFARTGASVGKTYLYDSKDGMLVFAGFLIRVKTDENVLLPEFFKYQTHTPQYKNWIAANSMRTGQPGINGNEYEEFTFSIPFKNNKPDLSAQRRIAAILTSADKVIAATQKTIAKYKQIKQGMMEELFNEQCIMNNGEWKKVRLGEVGDFYVGGDVDRSCFSPYPTVECRFPIYANALVNEGLYGYSNKYEFDKEAVTITGRGDVGKVFYRKPYFSTIIRLVTLIPTDSNIDVKFLSYAMSKINFIIESTGVPQLTAPQTKKYEVSVPYKNGKPDLTEQRRIASILSGIDAKIAAEEKVLEKYEKVKKGLMERLLVK